MNQIKNGTDEKTGSFLTMKDGTGIFYRQDFVEKMKAVIVIVHGVCEHSGRYSYLSGRLNAEGYGVIRFDLRGHGKSYGERGFVGSFLDFAGDANEFVEKARQEAPGLPVYMLGHSMGSFISVTYAINYPDRISGQILSGIPATILPLPSIRLLKLLPYNLFPMVRAGNDLGKVVSRDSEVVADYISDPLNLKKSTLKMNSEMFLKGPAWLAEHVQECTLPCLVLHGGTDLIVTPASSEWFFDNISSTDKKRIIYPELYHEIFNEKERDIVIGDVLKWLEERVEKDKTGYMDYQMGNM